MSYALGQPVALATAVYDATGVLANATAVVLTITAPDGTVTTPTVTNGTTGNYSATFTPPAVGRYSYQWVATGTNASAAPADVFTVTGALASTVVGLDEVKDELRLTTVDAARDARLRGYLDAATSMVVNAVGPIVPTTFSEVHNGGGLFIMLRNPPVLSVTSITEYVGLTPYPLTLQPLGSTTDQYGYSLHTYSGKVTRRDSTGTPVPFRGGKESIAVTYTAGMTSINPAIRLAVIHDIRGLWSQTQNGGQPTPFGDAQVENQWAGPMSLFPRLAAELQSQQRVPGIA